MREEERKRPTGLCRWPLYEKFQYSTHFESAVRAGRYSRKLSSWTLWSSLTIHTHRRGSRTPNRGVSLFGRRFFFGLFDSLTLVSVSFLAVCVLCAFVCLFVCVLLTSECVCLSILVTDVLSTMAPVAFSSSATNNEESLHHPLAAKEVAWHGQVRRRPRG
jgi:hypothetical protein